MWTHLSKLIAVALLWVVSSAAAGAAPLYLCDDGRTVLLTDDASLGCPVYRPAADLIVVESGASWEDVQWAVATAIADRYRPGTFPTGTASSADLCAQWIDLNLRTDGGLDMETAEQTRRWLALSRIVTATNLCEEAFRVAQYPRF